MAEAEGVMIVPADPVEVSERQVNALKRRQMVFIEKFMNSRFLVRVFFECGQ